MTFTPVVPFGGSAGWAFLQRTRESQQETFVKSPLIARNLDAFEARIGGITTAQELVDDRQLLEVALGAFGLDDDINNKFFVQKILESNTRDNTGLASKLSDKRYLAFARAFGFGDIGGARTGDAGFATRIGDFYKDRQFEVAVGEVDEDMRLVMGLKRDLTEVAGKPSLSDDGKWFTVMATPPLRAVFETALGLPKSFGTLDLDRQLETFRDRAESVFGVKEVADFKDPEKQEELTRLFLVRSQVANGAISALTRGSAALALLQAGQRQY